ncbi:hypothetical protein PISMIDRAFT_18795 [Pisolithus microcarpus 441]|uniref:Unplaced genomic scaffold scaffold_406, whole genome shotgun sequence n=1 Tax=Pisolithus microcarpus 441 TaxID=765257 RepID=A0A0C9YPQ5_9AGAM|nr:hypothetical protein BKA83DRAFT_18795 [Pisolithus microcarpus]KIK12362.1 hypothetical protein PISMIDRAFT_18795 [Pisolithus microcarpus 441]
MHKLESGNRKEERMLQDMFFLALVIPQNQRETTAIEFSSVFQLQNYEMTNSPARALPPFDHAKADVILRSSDGVDFRVFELFLSLASPFFETLFDLPQPSQAANADTEIEDGLPVFPVSEGSKTLHSSASVTLHSSRGSRDR